MQVKIQPEQYNILGYKVVMIPADITYKTQTKQLDVDFSVVTIANSEDKDVMIEEVELPEEISLFMTEENNSSLFLKIKVSSIKELIVKICKIYFETFKKLKGIDTYYLTKITFHEDNMINALITKKELVDKIN